MTTQELQARVARVIAIIEALESALEEAHEELEHVSRLGVA